MRVTFIYILWDPRNNGKCYIGKSNNPTRRFLYGHCSVYTVIKTKKESWIKSLKNKGLKPILEVIDEVPISEWKFWEMYYISLYKSWGFSLTNGTLGGDGVTAEEAKRLNTPAAIFKRVKTRSNNATQRGYYVSEETKLKLRHINLGKKHSEQAKLKRSLKLKGRKWSSEVYNSRRKPKPLSHSIRMSKLHKGKSLSEETKTKIKHTLKSRVLSQEALVNIAKGNQNKGLKPILQYSLANEFLARWEGIKYAASALKVRNTDISACLTKKQKSAGGYRWVYA